eukprot:3018216-Karenia_brevis.AAC.1
MKKLGLEDWVSRQRRIKWRWAHTVVNDKHDKWSLKALLWDPSSDLRLHANRRAARPWKRWTDDLVATAQRLQNQVSNLEYSQRHCWMTFASLDKWMTLEDDFVNVQ